MEILKVIVKDLLGASSVLVGLVAFIGLVFQKKPMHEVFKGTIKTITGFLDFGIGSAATAAALRIFQALFSEGFNLNGVLP